MLARKTPFGESPHHAITESITVTALTVPGVFGAIQMVQAPPALEAATVVVTAVPGPSAPAHSKRFGRQ